MIDQSIIHFILFIIQAIMEAARQGNAAILQLLMKWPYPDGMSIQMQVRHLSIFLENLINR